MQSLFRRFFVIIAAVSVSAVVCSADSDSLRTLVGGVEVQPDGCIRSAPAEDIKAAGQWLTSIMQPVEPDLAAMSPLRKISLKKLDAEMQSVVAAKGGFADSVRYLAGLASIQYLIAVPEANDILLVGPGEGWITDGAGNVIGQNSKLPVLSLENFLTLFRSWNGTAKQDVVSCSFDLTPEAENKIAQLDREYTGVDEKNAKAFADALENSYSYQQIHITGIDATSRLAKILVAADFRMKQYALGLETPPVRTVPSYAGLITGKPQAAPTKFYLVAEYDEVQYDSKKLTWQLGNVKVKVLTEYDYLQRQHGTAANTKPDRAAANWCSKLEANFESLAKKEPVFNELKNGMLLALAAALIRSENLLQKANCSLPVFSDAVRLRPLVYPQPKTVQSQATITKNGYSTVVVCGGIEINPFSVLQKTRLESKMDKDRNRLIKMTSDNWYGH
jgi:hypothetical protein